MPGPNKLFAKLSFIIFFCFHLFAAAAAVVVVASFLLLLLREFRQRNFYLFLPRRRCRHFLGITRRHKEGEKINKQAKRGGKFSNQSINRTNDFCGVPFWKNFYLYFIFPPSNLLTRKFTSSSSSSYNFYFSSNESQICYSYKNEVVAIK